MIFIFPDQQQNNVILNKQKWKVDQYTEKNLMFPNWLPSLISHLA